MKSDQTKEELFQEIKELKSEISELENELEIIKKSEEKYRTIVGKFLKLSNEMIMAINEK
jgi:prefoldin subunit 5